MRKAFPVEPCYDKRTFENANIVEQGEICPHCNAVTIRGWQDYFVED